MYHRNDPLESMTHKYSAAARAQDALEGNYVAGPHADTHHDPGEEYHKQELYNSASGKDGNDDSSISYNTGAGVDEKKEDEQQEQSINDLLAEEGESKEPDEKGEDPQDSQFQSLAKMMEQEARQATTHQGNAKHTEQESDDAHVRRQHKKEVATSVSAMQQEQRKTLVINLDEQVEHGL